MKYALIGKKLNYSYSKFIHSHLKIDYELFEVPNEDDFIKILKEENFIGLNITMPYKKIAVSYADFKDKIVEETGVCNTLININGFIMAYNFDYYGFEAMIKRNKIDLFNKNILVLGNGATSATISNYLNKQNINSLTIVSRNGYINYSNIDAYLPNIDILINTTPLTMQNKEEPSLNYSLIKESAIGIDVNYNPYNNDFLSHFKKSYNGLYMLVYQAMLSEAYFKKINITRKQINEIYYQTLLEYNPIFLVGMPYSGKSYLGSNLAKHLNKEFIDLDEMFYKTYKIKPNEYIIKYGEIKFRELEEILLMSLSLNNKIIALGGGTLSNARIIRFVKTHGIVINITRPLKLISFDSTRPLTSNIKDYKNLLRIRKSIYNRIENIRITNNDDINVIVNRVIRKIGDL